MFKREIRRFIVLNHENEPITVDMSSGGYPYATKELNRITLFHLKHEAEQYAASFRHYKAIPVIMTIEEI